MEIVAEARDAMLRCQRVQTVEEEEVKIGTLAVAVAVEAVVVEGEETAKVANSLFDAYTHYLKSVECRLQIVHRKSVILYTGTRPSRIFQQGIIR
jgi:hypothetical protein